MKIFQIFNNMCYYDMTHLYKTVEEARAHYAPSIQIEETPDYVFESWGYDNTKEGNERFIKPTPPEGWGYDEETGTFYPLNPEPEPETDPTNTYGISDEIYHAIKEQTITEVLGGVENGID